MPEINSSMLKRANRQRIPLKIGMSGPSGSGKTYSALLLAHGLTSWEKIAVIDTENGSADLYSHLGAYNTLTLHAPFSPEHYIEAIQQCEAAGMEVIIIDSMTPEWAGVGGCLEIQEKLGGRYQDWAKVKPRHRKFLDTILNSPCHIVVTVRSKQDYAMDTENGKTKVTKVGLKKVTEEGLEYELTISFDINHNHLAFTSKDRTGIFMDKPEFVVGTETGQALKNWTESGSQIKQEKTTSTVVSQQETVLTNVNDAMSNSSTTTVCTCKTTGKFHAASCPMFKGASNAN